LLPKKERLRKEKDIKETIHAKQYYEKGPLLSLTAKDNDLGNSRICIVTPKKIGKATERNRIRRKMIAAYANIGHNTNEKCIDMVVFPRRIVLTSKNDEIRNEVEKMLLKIQNDKSS